MSGHAVCSSAASCYHRPTEKRRCRCNNFLVARYRVSNAREYELLCHFL